MLISIPQLVQPPWRPTPNNFCLLAMHSSHYKILRTKHSMHNTINCDALKLNDRNGVKAILEPDPSGGKNIITQINAQEDAFLFHLNSNSIMGQVFLLLLLLFLMFHGVKLSFAVKGGQFLDFGPKRGRRILKNGSVSFSSIFFYPPLSLSILLIRKWPVIRKNLSRDRVIIIIFSFWG